MARPRKQRRIRYSPKVVYYKPRGVPLRELSEVVLQLDEMEALRLKEVEGMRQVEASKLMGISQPTLARILKSVQAKLGRAIVMGMAIRVEK